MTKNVYKQKCFSGFTVTIKNLNCEILTKNLVTFKRWDLVKYGKLWGYTKKSNFYGKVHEKPMNREDLLINGALGSF